MTEQPMPCSGYLRDGGPCTGVIQPQYSLGIYAGRWCDGHWKTSGYRKEGRQGFDPADCGETYEPDDGESWFNDGGNYDGGFGIGDD